MALTDWQTHRTITIITSIREIYWTVLLSPPRPCKCCCAAQFARVGPAGWGWKIISPTSCYQIVPANENRPIPTGTNLQHNRSQLENFPNFTNPGAFACFSPFWRIFSLSSSLCYFSKSSNCRIWYRQPPSTMKRRWRPQSRPHRRRHLGRCLGRAESMPPLRPPPISWTHSICTRKRSRGCHLISKFMGK